MAKDDIIKYGQFGLQLAQPIASAVQQKAEEDFRKKMQDERFRQELQQLALSKPELGIVSDAKAGIKSRVRPTGVSGFAVDQNAIDDFNKRKMDEFENKMRMEYAFKDELEKTKHGYLNEQQMNEFKQQKDLLEQKGRQALELGNQEDANRYKRESEILQKQIDSGKYSGKDNLTAGQKITAKREIRSVYDELPAKIDYFGKGQIRGSHGLKSDLDAILAPVNGDFNKLSPQGLAAFVFRMNKSNDPTSATLLAEAQQIANRTGIGDRVSTAIEKFTSGKDTSPEVARDIYNIISQVESMHRKRFIESVKPLKEDLDSIGVKFTSIGVPKDVQDEIEGGDDIELDGGQASPKTQSPAPSKGKSTKEDPLGLLK